MTTLAPFWANNFAVAAPTPEEDPVTIATAPFGFIFFTLIPSNYPNVKPHRDFLS